MGTHVRVTTGRGTATTFMGVIRFFLFMLVICCGVWVYARMPSAFLPSLLRQTLHNGLHDQHLSDVDFLWPRTKLYSQQTLVYGLWSSLVDHTRMSTMKQHRWSGHPLSMAGVFSRAIVISSVYIVHLYIFFKGTNHTRFVVLPNKRVRDVILYAGKGDTFGLPIAHTREWGLQSVLHDAVVCGLAAMGRAVWERWRCDGDGVSGRGGTVRHATRFQIECSHGLTGAAWVCAHLRLSM